ncbi:hypothetical protein C7N43_31965 [Sphingobacteriales bacterium UPWRP_1]|nr:hypothetical protein BVG80_01465 [Sphingobacteriales bacterium TSM_CSM]PSJ72879.1 hypothetical protein C7N43_31965 [Sphingobacteriales bacterium UPWRP_1]
MNGKHIACKISKFLPLHYWSKENSTTFAIYNNCINHLPCFAKETLKFVYFYHTQKIPFSYA